MKFKSHQIKGKGRGKLLGFPTINLKIPENFNIDEGIYAVKVRFGGKEFPGAMHLGPIPTFNENEKTLEIFLIDANDKSIPASGVFEFETVKYLRPVLSFPNQEELVKQIKKDVDNAKYVLRGVAANGAPHRATATK